MPTTFPTFLHPGHRLKPATDLSLARPSGPRGSGRGRRLLTVVSLAVALAPTFASAAAAEGPTWVGDYQTADLSQWSQTHVARPDGVAVVASPVRDGHTASAKFTVRPGDRTFGQRDAERAEVMTGVTETGAVEGQETWHGWSSMFPAGTATQRGSWMIFTQFHQTARTCPPNVAFMITDSAVPRIRLSVKGGWLDTSTCASGHSSSYDLGPLPIDTWMDFTVHAKWSSDPGQGTIQVKLDGRTVLASVPVANLYTGQSAYLKQGVYRGNMNHTTVVYHAGTKRGATEADVSPRSSDVPISSDGTSAVLVGTDDRAVTGRNVPRTADALVVYDRSSGRTASPVNRWGFEAAVVDGKVVAVRDYSTGMPIPVNGFVISGHGTSRHWLKTHAAVGTAVVLPESTQASTPPA